MIPFPGITGKVKREEWLEANSGKIEKSAQNESNLGLAEGKDSVGQPSLQSILLPKQIGRETDKRSFGRGRPRKYPKLEVDHEANAYVPGIQNPNRGENVHAPPGFGVVNGNQPCQAGPVNNAVDDMIGQSVYGVIEATFDAGYLLNVRVGDTETTLRGVVFKPGHYVPVNPENDIAPDVPMIIRNEIPLTRESKTQAHTRKPGPRGRNGTAHADRAANPVGSKGKQVFSVVPQTPTISRGNVVPVVLQPVNLSNDAPSASATNQTDYLVPSKGKQVLDSAQSSNRLTPPSEIIPFQSRNNHQKLLTEVIKHAPSQSTETNSSLAVNLSVEDSAIVGKKDASDTESVKPLQVLQSHVDSHPADASRPSEDCKIGKMIQFLQENMTT
ncbi:AT hook motif-containing protein [Salix suchowensis]|nr:AT hook motif-containing protein [Salix suchowensis]